MKKISLSMVLLSLAAQPLSMVAAASPVKVVADETRSGGIVRARFLYEHVTELPAAGTVVAFSQQESSEDLKRDFSSAQPASIVKTSIIPGIKELNRILTAEIADFTKSGEKERTVAIRIELKERLEHVVVEFALKKQLNGASKKAARLVVEVKTYGLTRQMPEYLLNLLKAVLLEDTWMQKNGMVCAGVTFVAALAAVGTGVVVRNNRLATQKEFTSFDGLAQKMADAILEEHSVRGSFVENLTKADYAAIDLKDEGLLGPVPVTALAYTDDLKSKKGVLATVFFPGQLEALAPSLCWAFNQEQGRVLIVPKQVLPDEETLQKIAKDLNYGRWQLVVVDETAEGVVPEYNTSGLTMFDNVVLFHVKKQSVLRVGLRVGYDRVLVKDSGTGIISSASKDAATEALEEQLLSVLSRENMVFLPSEETLYCKISRLRLNLDPVSCFLRSYNEAAIDATEKFVGTVLVDIADTIAYAAVKRNAKKFAGAVLVVIDSSKPYEMPGTPDNPETNSVVKELLAAGFKNFIVSGLPANSYSSGYSRSSVSSTGSTQGKQDFFFVMDGKSGTDYRKLWNIYSETTLRQLQDAAFSAGLRFVDVELSTPTSSTSGPSRGEFASGVSGVPRRAAQSSRFGVTSHDEVVGVDSYFEHLVTKIAEAKLGCELERYGYGYGYGYGYLKKQASGTRHSEVDFAYVEVFESQASFDSRKANLADCIYPVLAIILPEDTTQKPRVAKIGDEEFTRDQTEEEKKFEAVFNLLTGKKAVK